MIPPEELRHVDDGPRPDESPGGIGLAEVLATTTKDPAELLRRCREVLRAVLMVDARTWPREDEWAERLPEWFVEVCAPERSPQEEADWLARWRRLGEEDRARVAQERAWTLSEWIWWLQPDERTWHWWDSATAGPHLARVVVELPSWPTPSGALTWLLRAAGAETVDVDALS